MQDEKSLCEGYISWWSKAIELNSNDAKLYINRGGWYNPLGEYDKAIADCNRAIELNPKLAGAYLFRGLAYENKDQYDKAISDYTKAIEIDPELSGPYNQKAWLLATCSDTIYRDGAKSVELAEKAVKLNPGTDYLDTLAAAYAEAGRFEDAIATQEKVIKKERGIQYFQRLISYKAHQPWRQSKSDKLAGKK